VSAAVLLAAGFGTRMGGPKALLLHEGQPLVALHVARLLELGVDELVVVAHPSFAARIETVLGRGLARVVSAVTNQQAESLGCGLRSLGGAWQYVWIALVDTLPPRPSTFRGLAAAV